MIDGRVVDKLAATVSPLDHGLLFGDGVTVGFRLYGGVPFRLDAHLARLAEVADRVGLKLPHTASEFAQQIATTVASSQRSEGYVKLIVTRGAGTVGPDPRKCVPAVVVIVDDLLPVPPELREFGQCVATAKVRRHVGHPSDWGGILNGLLQVLATQQAYAAGCLEALILDDAGRLTGPPDGVLVVRRNGQWQTPKLAVHPDPVMLAVLGEVCEPLTLIELTPAAWPDVTEAFTSSSASEWAPIRAVDGRDLPTPVGPDTATGRVFAALHALTRGKSGKNPESALAAE